MLACGVITFSACSSTAEGQTKMPEKGEFCTLQEAYDCGLLTQDDLLSIAYYTQGTRLNEELMGESFSPKPKNPETLSETTKEEIIIALKEKTEQNYIVIHKYLGTYNNCIVIYYEDGLQYPAVAPTEYFSHVGGVTFSRWSPSALHLVVYIL